MNDITIRDLDDAIIQKLKQHAWQKGLPLGEFLRRLMMDASWAATPERLRSPVRSYRDSANGAGLN